MKKKKSRDIEKQYSKQQFIMKIRRLADDLERGKPFRIQIGNERLHIPAGAVVNIEHERGNTSEEVEFQLKWKK